MSVVSDIIMADVAANLPAASSANDGYLYYETDTGLFKRSNGASWVTVADTNATNYTDEKAQDAIGAMIADTDTVDITYTDATPELKADVKKQMSITSDASGLMLSGDSATPGNDKVYGTNGSGTKGWKDDPAGGSVDDTAYDATSWNGVTTIAPSKNAVRDKIESMSAGGRTLIAELTPTGTGTASFTSIPGGHKKLVLEFAIRSTQAANAVDGYIQFNTDTTAGNYHYNEYHRNSAGAGNNSGNSYIFAGPSAVSAANAPANGFCVGKIEIVQYANANFYKVANVEFTMDYDVTTVFAQYFNQSVRWLNANAITQIDIVLSAGNFASNSVLRLYYED